MEQRDGGRGGGGIKKPEKQREEQGQVNRNQIKYKTRNTNKATEPQRGHVRVWGYLPRGPQSANSISSPICPQGANSISRPISGAVPTKHHPKTEACDKKGGSNWPIVTLANWSIVKLAIHLVTR